MNSKRSKEDFKLLGTFDHVEVRYTSDTGDQEPLLLIDQYFHRLSNWWVHCEATIDALGLSDWWSGQNEEILDCVCEKGILSEEERRQLDRLISNRYQISPNPSLRGFPMFPGIVTDGSIRQLADKLVESAPASNCK
ncbi:hypothetical protein ACFOY8_14495 [Thalassospira xianhensis]|uniref:Uncharacterized protein n=1 Tax=Thalassospira xianhensis MCCC 1A02616 TaxID=1177929 RepID=A0A367UHF2_9PROT|nr:hypothetical protein [Thalassospira xianhensis]RCK07638.1 hypothetical protein TH5_00750 [Thalassospira xianhensis MCCC 1A02616]